MPLAKPTPPEVSSKYQTIRELITASLTRKPKAGTIASAQVFEFADPAFAKFYIRADFQTLENLKDTSVLYPAEWIFNGPEIATSLLEGASKGKRSYFTGISILAKQEGESLESIQMKRGGNRKLSEALAEHPEKLDHLFRTVAFVGLHDKTANVPTNYSGLPRLDVNLSNIFRAEDGSLSLIDQMSHENVSAQFGISHVNGPKAFGSLSYIRQELLNVVEKGIKAGADKEQMHMLERTIITSSDKIFDTLQEAARISRKGDEAAWNYLKSELSDKHTEQWRGLEDGPTNSTTFKTVHQISAKALDMDKGAPKQLLALLNKLHGASLARTR